MSYKGLTSKEEVGKHKLNRNKSIRQLKKYLTGGVKNEGV